MSTPKILTALILILGTPAIIGCDDDGPVRPISRADIHGVVRGGGDRVDGAVVYLAREPGFAPMFAPFVVDSTVTGPDGIYEFDDIDPGLYRTYAGVWGGGDFVRVSSYTDVLDLTDGNLPDKAAPQRADLDLRYSDFEGVVTGDVWIQTDEAAPVDSARVTLLRYLGAHLDVEGEAWTDAEGAFALTDVRTGNYTASALKEWPVDAPFPLYMSGETEPFFVDGVGTVAVPRMWLYEGFVEKPAIYIDPVEAGTFRVELVLDHGTRLTHSDPEYGEGWDVEVDEGGLIDGRWDYLFYEVAIAAWPRLEKGWCVEREDLGTQLANIGNDFGLKPNELDDFLDYWTTRLPRRDWYVIKPVAGPHLDVWVELRIDPEPDSVLRFWLFFQGSDAWVDVPPPAVLRVGRTGTTVAEWGGAVLPAAGR